MFAKRTPLARINTFVSLKGQEQCWCLLIYIFSAVIRLAILLCPFSKLRFGLGHFQYNAQLSSLVDDQQSRLACRIGFFVERICDMTPWESKCLVQAFVARLMLSYYKIPYVVFLGARMKAAANQPLLAHAWVTVGSDIIVGGTGIEGYAIVGVFVCPSIAMPAS